MNKYFGVRLGHIITSPCIFMYILSRRYYILIPLVVYSRMLCLTIIFECRATNVEWHALNANNKKLNRMLAEFARG